MRILILLAAFTFALATGCKKPSNCVEPPPKDCSEPKSCNSSEATTRQITGKTAKIELQGGQYYVVEYMNNIDTRLLPCNLEKEFQVDGLMVTVSGNVKGSVKNVPMCCTDNFEITSICR